MHPKLHWLVVLGALFGGLASGSAHVRAQPVGQEERYHVLVLASASAEIMVRLQGQTKDLAVELRSVDALPTMASAAERKTFLAAHDAQAAVWIEAQPDGQGYAVHVVDAVDGEAHSRHLPVATAGADDSDPHAALAESATFEQVAIVVRSELSLLLEARRERRAHLQTELGGQASTITSAATPAAAVSDRSETETVKLGDSAPPARARPWGRVRMSAGWDITLAGRDHLAHAAAVRCGLAFGAFEFAVGARLGVPTTLQGVRADARVARHDATLGLALVAPLSTALQLSVGARLGVIAFARSTRRHDTTLSATPDRTSLAVEFGPVLLLRARVVPNFGFQLELHADVVPSAPRYALQAAGKSVEIAHEGVLEPGLGLGLFWAI